MSVITTTLYGDITVFPLRPLTGAVDSLEYLTDVFTSYNGTEKTLKIRQEPRRKISYGFFEDYIKKINGFLTQYGSLTKLWGIPLWFEKQTIGSISGGGTSITCDTEYYDFRDDSLAFLFESFDSWQVIEIDTVGPTGLTLTTTLEAFTNADIMPLRIGNIAGNLIRNSNGRNVISKISFDIKDHIDPTPLAASETYKGDDLYFDQILMKSDTYQMELSTRIDITDYDYDDFNKYFPWSKNRVERPYFNIFKTQEEIYNFRRFLARRSGKYLRYWEPSFEQDVRLLSIDTTNDYIIINADSFNDTDMQRENIAIKDINGDWTVYGIASVEDYIGDTVKLILTDDITLNTEDVEIISFLGLKRFNTDSIDIQFNYSPIIAEVEIKTIEITS